MTNSHKENTIEQARAEIANLKDILLSRKFEGVWLSSMIKVNGRDMGPVPKTVFEAYTALRKYEKEDPVKALAAFYSKFVVAVRPEFDHSSRDEKTRRYYKLMADRKDKVTNIFPNNPKAIELFNAYLKLEVQSTLLEKSPEQKGFLAFQADVEKEMENIQSMSQQLEIFERLIKHEKKKDILENDFSLLMKVVDRMKTADISNDVDLYAKDALVILDSIKSKMGHNDQIEQIKDSIQQFQGHHTELMTDLSDKEKALYFRSFLQVAAITVGSHLVEHSGFHSYTKNIMEFGLGIGLAKSADKEKIGPKFDDPSLHSIHAVDKAQSLSDTYVNVTNALLQPETKDRLSAQGGLAMSVALFPTLAVPVAVTSAIYNAGGVALNFYTEKNQLAAAEKAAKKTRDTHKSEMEKYLETQQKHETDTAPSKPMKRTS